MLTFDDATSPSRPHPTRRSIDVIESLDTQLFERVTGLTLKDFHMLSEVGVFHAAHMDEAIWQFRLFERSSLDYLGTTPAGSVPERIGLWETTVEAPTAVGH